MCGRARLSSDVSEIKLVFSIPPERPTPNFPPSWNVAPLVLPKTPAAPAGVFNLVEGIRPELTHPAEYACRGDRFLPYRVEHPAPP
jgi:hypothetical protein